MYETVEGNLEYLEWIHEKAYWYVHECFFTQGNELNSLRELKHSDYWNA